MIFIGNALHAQTKVLKGMVMDAVTLEPLPYTHILRNYESGTRPDQFGHFEVTVNHLDTISVSHVSYITHNQVVKYVNEQDTLIWTIFLEKELKTLGPITVSPFPTTLNDFKRLILDSNVNHPAQNFSRQQKAITFDMILGPKVSYDAYENYRRINQPQGFTIFSTGPSKGIGRALKSFGIGKKNK